MRSMARQTSRRAARRGGILPRPAALGVRARGTKGQATCPTCGDALARFGSGNLNIYSEAYTGGPPMRTIVNRPSRGDSADPGSK